MDSVADNSISVRDDADIIAICKDHSSRDEGNRFYEDNIIN